MSITNSSKFLNITFYQRSIAIVLVKDFKYFSWFHNLDLMRRQILPNIPIFPDDAQSQITLWSATGLFRATLAKTNKFYKVHFSTFSKYNYKQRKSLLRWCFCNLFAFFEGKHIGVLNYLCCIWETDKSRHFFYVSWYLEISLLQMKD